MEPCYGFQEHEGTSCLFEITLNLIVLCVEQTGARRILFDAVKDGQNISPKWVLPEDQQESNESQRCVFVLILFSCSLIVMLYRLWKDLTRAIIAKDMEAATVAKTAVEDAQREMRRKMEESGEKHVPRFFVLKDKRWQPKIECVPFLISLPSSILHVYIELIFFRLWLCSLVYPWIRRRLPKSFETGYSLHHRIRIRTPHLQLRHLGPQDKPMHPLRDPRLNSSLSPPLLSSHALAFSVCISVVYYPTQVGPSLFQLIFYDRCTRFSPLLSFFSPHEI